MAFDTTVRVGAPSTTRYWRALRNKPQPLRNQNCGAGDCAKKCPFSNRHHRTLFTGPTLLRATHARANFAGRFCNFENGVVLRENHVIGGSCGVTNIGLTIPHPIISLALSPCERYLAIASASRSVAVLDLPLVVEQMKAGAAASVTQTQGFSETQAEVGLGAGMAVLKQQGTHVL